MAAWNFETTGTPGQISQAFNNYLNGWIGIQPDQGILQGLGTVIGQQLTASGAPSFALRLQGETDQYNTWFHVTLFEQPKT